MAKTNEPVLPDEPQEAKLPLVERLAERMRTLNPDDPGAAADVAQLATVSAGLAALRVQMKDLEKSLVERIADVDDDRRLTANQLQRAWQSQREEQESLRRGRGKLLAGTLVLITALGAGGLYGLYRHVQSSQEALDSRISALRLELNRVAGIETQDSQVQGKIAALSDAVGQLSRALSEGPDRRVQEGNRAESSAQISTLAARVERIGAEQTRIEKVLEGLRGTLTPSPPSPPSPASGTVAKPPAAPTPGGSTESLAPPRTAEPKATAPESGDASPATSPPPDAAALPLQTVPVGDRPFALQIMGSYRREDLLTQAAKSSLPAKVFLRQESRYGRPWYVLIYSMHSSRAQAEEALAALPQSLRAPKPWIRNYPPDATVEPIDIRTGP